MELTRSALKRYAQTTLRLKNTDPRTPAHLEEVVDAIANAYTSIYAAVAFDIDGTLTKQGETTVDPEMAASISHLLYRGVFVILITGRGRMSAREAADQVVRHTSIASPYLRRLFCITHNGLVFLSSTGLQRDDFLRNELLIGTGFEGMLEIREKVYGEFQKEISQRSLYITEEPSDQHLALRLTIRDDQAVSPLRVSSFLNDIVGEILAKGEDAQEVRVSKGTYGQWVSFDITTASKKAALVTCAKEFGILPVQIVRIGDNGQEDGNDFDLLDSERGFSVNTLSCAPCKCLPVLDETYCEQLHGVVATRVLLGRLRLHPPLTLVPDKELHKLAALRKFEHLAILRAKRETQLLTATIRGRLSRLLPDEDRSEWLSFMSLRDLFDRCGAVRMRDYEIDELEPAHPLRALFRLTKDVCSGAVTPPLLDRCLFTDSSIILRGPFYYWAMTKKEEELSLSAYLKDAQAFIEESLAAIQLCSESSCSVEVHKLLLGVMDNIRNILLQLLYAAYFLESQKLPTYKTFPIARWLMEDFVLTHTSLHLDFLIWSEYGWARLLGRYCDYLEELCAAIGKLVSGPFSTLADACENQDRLLRKWRECDNIIENYLAVDIALHELEPLLIDDVEKPKRKAIGLSLLYGGIELGAIAKVLASRAEIPFLWGFMHVSLYGDKIERIKAFRYCPEEYYQEITDLSRGLVSSFFAEKEDMRIEEYRVLMLDDNCTTLRTLQTARDALIREGADVVGAVIVRYPSTNRYRQMAFPNHGCPDPNVLLSFVRGLVSPSPYSRLLRRIDKKEDDKTPYQDKLRIFNKGRDRIERYLLKNGTQASAFDTTLINTLPGAMEQRLSNSEQ